MKLATVFSQQNCVIVDMINYLVQLKYTTNHSNYCSRNFWLCNDLTLGQFNSCTSLDKIMLVPQFRNLKNSLGTGKLYIKIIARQLNQLCLRELNNCQLKSLKFGICAQLKVFSLKIVLVSKLVTQVCMAPFNVWGKVCIAPIHVRSKVCKFAPHMDGSNAYFAPHMEGRHADFTPHMEQRHSFRDKIIAETAIVLPIFKGNY